MIRILENEEINRKQWDQAVTDSCFPSVYGLSWFLDLVSPGWGGMVVDNYNAVFPLPLKKKFGITYLAQPPFTQQLGVFSREPVEETLIRTLILHMKSKIPYADIQLNETNRVKGNGFQVIPRKNIILPLSSDSGSPIEAYHTQTARNLAMFRGSGLKVFRDNTAFTMVIDLFVREQGKKYKGISNRHYGILEILCHRLLTRELLDVRIVRNRLGKTIAGALFVHSMDRYVFLFSANSTEGYAVSAMPAIIDLFIRNHAGEHKILDFEGSDNPGLARFYHSFGGRDVEYLRILFNRLPWPVRVLKSR
ncbi:MAG: hypothetical protein GXO83_01915 [Chlorobi bacterium]|nr:hypothetical protein [Chlorobiota bacterium]